MKNIQSIHSSAAADPATSSFSSVLKIIAALALATVSAPSVGAAEAITDPGLNSVQSYSIYAVGYSFTVGASDITLTHAGVININNMGVSKASGLAGTVPWAIWDVTNSNALVYETTIAAGTGAGLLFAYKDIPDVTLIATHTYKIATVLAGGFDDGDFYRDNGGSSPATLSSDFTGLESGYSDYSFYGNPLTIIGGGTPNTAYVGPNFQYTIGGGGGAADTPFAVTSFSTSGTEATVTWESTAGRNYVVQSSLTLVSWTDISTFAATTTSSTITATDPNLTPTPSKVFYRVARLPLP